MGKRILIGVLLFLGTFLVLSLYLPGLRQQPSTVSGTAAIGGPFTLTDAKGAKHPWRKDMLEVLTKRQKADGSWTNEKDRWMEGDTNLVTGFALMALGNIRGAK